MTLLNCGLGDVLSSKGGEKKIALDHSSCRASECLPSRWAKRREVNTG